jgi:hypothetical protein
MTTETNIMSSLDSKVFLKAMGGPAPTPDSRTSSFNEDDEERAPDYEAPPSPALSSKRFKVLDSEKEDDIQPPSEEAPTPSPRYEAPSPTPSEDAPLSPLLQKKRLRDERINMPPPKRKLPDLSSSSSQYSSTYSDDEESSASPSKKSKPLPPLPPKPNNAKAKKKPIPPPRPPKSQINVKDQDISAKESEKVEQEMMDSPPKKRGMQRFSDSSPNLIMDVPPSPDEYIKLHETLCVMRDAPSDVRKNKRDLIMKMAKAFDIKSSDNAVICEQVGEFIKKTRVMNDIEKHVLTCTRLVNEFDAERKKHQSDVQATVQSEVDFLLNLVKNVKPRFQDPKVSAKQLEEDLKSFQICENLVRMARDNLRRSSASTKNRRTMTSDELQDAQKRLTAEAQKHSSKKPSVQKPSVQKPKPTISPVKTTPSQQQKPGQSPTKEEPFWLQILNILFK